MAMTGCSAEPAGDPDAPPAMLPSELRDIVLTPDTTLVSGLVPRSTTLDTLLRGHGVADDAAMSVVKRPAQVFDPRRLRALQPFSIERTLEGTLRFFQDEIDNDRFLRVAPRPASARSTPPWCRFPRRSSTPRPPGASMRETPSLFQSMSGAGESAELAVALAEIFSGEIDFNSDCSRATATRWRSTSTCARAGSSSYGDITAAEFRNDGRVLRAIRFTSPGGKPAYYDEQGRSLRRFFLRSPLKFEPRVTSRFSSSRRHPVLHTNRAHRGVDYGAPTGAPVIAVAAGVVVSATYDGTNGRMVRVRHASGYESSTCTCQRSRPASAPACASIRGRPIGRVGATGLATGPHLHYGLRERRVREPAARAS